MKILVVGDWHSELHEEAVACALETSGHLVERFAWHTYFAPSGNFATDIWLKVQNKYLWGSQITRLNRDLLSLVNKSQPDAVFIYRGTHVLPDTLRAIRSVAPGVVLVGYNNDDPFASGHVTGLWRHFIAGLPELDIALAYRHANVEDFRHAGVPRVELLRSWYIPERNHPVQLSPDESERFESDVVFVGHYENDMRLACLEEVVRRGWKLKLFGHREGWQHALRSSPVLQHLHPVSTVWGDDYNRALCGARVALCFFSKLNRDTYTRRCFEIPASGTLMLSEYSDDLAAMFTPGVEADFFRSPQQLGEKLDKYLRDETLRLSVSSAGRARLEKDGHDVITRMRTVVGWIDEIKEKNGQRQR
jgi:spore maturation protein CgeB